MSKALRQLLDILSLEKIDTNIYRGHTAKTSNQRVFGGQVFAQAMRAAQDTVPDERMVHSQHAYFLRPGDPTLPILYQVDGIRDGGSFTTRRVVASQRRKPFLIQSYLSKYLNRDSLIRLICLTVLAPKGLKMIVSAGIK